MTQPARTLRRFTTPNAQPVTVTSEYAEIIYFLRNGNLYRRVLLVAPELQSAIVPSREQRRRSCRDWRRQPPFSPDSWACRSGLAGPMSGELAGRQRPLGPSGGDRAEHEPERDGNATFAAQTIVLNTLGDPDQPREPVCLAAVRG